MKKFIIALVLALSFGAVSAAEYQLTPANGASVKSIKTAAANLGRYVLSAEGLAQGKVGLSGFDAAATARVIRGGIKICYGPETTLRYSETKPIAPFICLEDLVSLSNTTRTFGTAKKYNLALTPPMTEATFKAKLAEIVAE